MTAGWESTNPRQRAVFALVAACVFWGLGFPVMKALGARAEWLSPGIDTWFVSGLVVSARFLLAGALLLAFTPVRPSRREVVQGVVLGITAGIGTILQTDGLAYTEASTSAFLTQGYVVLLPLAAVAVSRQLPPLRVLACVLLVVLGAAVLSRFDPVTFSLGRGEAETLGAAFCFAFQILALDHEGFAGNRTAPVTVVMFGTIALVGAPVALAHARGAGDILATLGSAPSLGLFVVLAACTTLGSFWLMNRFQRAVTASEAGIIYGMEPVFGSAFALWLPELLSSAANIAYPNETLTARLLVGGGLVVAANVGLSVLQLSATPAPSASAGE